MGKRCVQGSFTLELAMIMGVILFVIFSVLMGSRMIYNRAKIVAHQYEYAITQREQEIAGLWGDQRERMSPVELEEIDPVAYVRKTQYIKEM